MHFFRSDIRMENSFIDNRSKAPRTLLIYSPIFSPINRPNILRIKNARARSVHRLWEEISIGKRDKH